MRFATGAPLTRRAAAAADGLVRIALERAGTVAVDRSRLPARAIPIYAESLMKGCRDDLCPCGSGRRYERCHLDADAALTLGGCAYLLGDIEVRGMLVPRQRRSNRLADLGVDVARTPKRDSASHREPDRKRRVERP